jgi:hypothetical protein
MAVDLKFLHLVDWYNNLFAFTWQIVVCYLQELENTQK